jgi:protein TonB
MSAVKPTVFTPYGAFELKATYQRNLATAFALTLTLVGTLVFVGWILTRGGTPPPTVVSDDGGWTKRSILEETPIPRPEPEGPSGPGRRAEVTGEGWIPNPVDDNSLPVDEGLILSRNEQSIMIDGGPGGGGGEDRTVTYSSEIDDFPPPDSFIVCEELPVLVHRVEPEYPRQATLMGLEGEVVIKALIDREGDVREALVAVSSGIESLDEAAVRAAFLNKYRPAIQSNRPVAIWITYTVRFKLE